MKNALITNCNKKTIIIVFANNRYSIVLENWFEAMRRIDVRNYLVISMDQLLFEQLQDKNIPCIKRICDPEIESIWVHRVNVIKEIMDYGYDVIHSDADALWLNDPQPYLEYMKHDLIFSQGTFWPKDVHKKWGFVLCCGFFYIKNNKNTLNFVKELCFDVNQSLDDQVSCNRLLLKKKIKWNNQDNYYIKSFRNIDFKCFHEVLEGKTEDMKIGILPHSKFQRVRDSGEDVYVKHIISEKNSDSIISILKQNNCWFIENKNGLDTI